MSSTATSTPPAATIDLAATSYEPEAGRNGGTLVVGDWEEANLFNPYYLGAATDRNVAAAAWSTLVKITDDDRYAPDLAAELPTLANGGVRVPGDGNDAMTVTWTLRDGLKWSDGQPLTCDDFRFAWEWVRDPENLGVDTSGFEDIKAFDCESATRMIWHFERIDPSYLTLMTAPLPRHYLEPIPMVDQVGGKGFKAADLPKLPVSGPFRFKSVTPGSELVMVKNPAYASFSTGKPAHLASLVWRWSSTATALIAAYKAGKVHLATGLDDDDLAAVKAFGAQMAATPSLTYEALVPNWSGASVSPPAGGASTDPGHCSHRILVIGDRGAGCPMADPAMRRAFASAIDKQAIVNAIHGGIGPIATSGFPAVAWWGGDDRAIPFDPARARQILDAAGWVAGPDGIRAKDGLRATVEVCMTDTPARKDTIGLIVAWLKDVGVEVVPDIVTRDALFIDPHAATESSPCALSVGNFDLALLPVTASVEPVDAFFAQHSSQISPNGANVASIDDPTIDGPLEVVASSVDPIATRQAMREVAAADQALIADIPLFWWQTVDLHAKKVGNYRPNPASGVVTWNVVDWFVKR